MVLKVITICGQPYGSQGQYMVQGQHGLNLTPSTGAAHPPARGLDDPPNVGMTVMAKMNQHRTALTFRHRASSI